MISELDEFDSYTAFSSRVRGFEAQTRMKGDQQNIGDIDEYLRNMQTSSLSTFRFKIKIFIFDDNVRISAYDPDPFDPDPFDFLSPDP